VARYCGGSPNGSARDIAGIRNEAGNVVGLMPHPEHAIDPLTGPGRDGLGFFTSVVVPQAPGRTPRERCPGAEDAPPEASEAPAREARK
jgi:phosphoribosylformylglycinamidine synthase